MTAGMPYANGPLHLGHLAGAHVPADVYARWLSLLIGRQNVLFVCGTDDHGSTSEISAMRAGIPIREFIDAIHAEQESTLSKYAIGLDVYSGTSQPESFPLQKELATRFIASATKNGMLNKRKSRQWYDPKAERFLPDRFVQGTCPNPKCGSPNAYSDECSVCGHQFDPEKLIDPKSTITDGVPEMRETTHLWLDMWQVADTLAVWLDGRKKTWRNTVISEVRQTIEPAISFNKDREAEYKERKKELPPHKMLYTPGGQVLLRFQNKEGLELGRGMLSEWGIESTLADGWAHRPMTRDISWGIPVAEDDPEIAGKTLYVWPDSLIAPISFSRVALKKHGDDPERYKEFWCDPKARVYQFLGQDNVFFYTILQGAMWLSMQEDPHRLPREGEFVLTEIFGCQHLMLQGEKLSKSTGNFVTGDDLLEKGYSSDQVRYYLSLLGLPEKRSDFDFETFERRNDFLAGPLNAAFEKPQSAAHSKFGGCVPDGKLIDDVEVQTVRMVQRYVGAMQKAAYPSMLFELENYARKINSLFSKYKPHDDRFPEEERRDALFTSFYLLKNLMIMLQPFVPEAMDRLRTSLNLAPDVFAIDQLGTGLPAGHRLGEQAKYFPDTPRTEGRGGAPYSQE